MTEKTCTSLDHIYPAGKPGKTMLGTPCYCGAKTWGGVPVPKHTRLKPGDRVKVRGTDMVTTVDTVSREKDGGIRLTDRVNGHHYWDRADLDRVP
jgi:hypothetical protein